MLKLVGCLSVAAMLACSPDTPSAPDGIFVGSYALTTVNGLPLPVATFKDSITLKKDEIVSGTLAISSRRVGPVAVPTYTLTLTQRLTRGGSVTVENLLASGTWKSTNSSDFVFSGDSSNVFSPVTGFYSNRSMSLSTVNLLLTFGQQ
jgi:hypothetical protein